MPIYAFQCTECGHSFDRLQKLSDADPSTCPACGVDGAVRRQLTDRFGVSIDFVYVEDATLKGTALAAALNC